MFAYCLNNPVNGCDPCGTCFHQLEFWNDCEKCGGRTWDEKLNDLATGIYGYATDVYDAHIMQNEWQQQVDQTSINAVRDSAVMVCDAIADGIGNMNEAEYQVNQLQHAFIADRFSTYTKAGNTLALIGAGIGFVDSATTVVTSSIVAGKIAGPIGTLVGAGLGIIASICFILAEGE